MNDYFFTSAPQLKGDPLGSQGRFMDELKTKLPLSTRILLAVFGPITRVLRHFGYRPFAERCSWCHADLPAGTAFYIEGRRVCEACAERGRKRMIRAAWAFVVLSALVLLLGVVFTVISLVRGETDAWQIMLGMAVGSLFPFGLLWFVLHAMKISNKGIDEREQAVSLFNTPDAMRDENPRITGGT